MADDLTSYLPMYTDPRLQAPAAGAQPLYAAGGIPLQNTRAVNGSWGTPAVPQPVAPQAAPVPAALPPATAPAPSTNTAENVSDFVKTVKSARPVRSAGGAMPKGATAPVVPNQAAEPLVPGVTGFQVNDGPVVPYGTRFLVSGNGSAQQLGGPGAGLYDNLPGGGKMVGGRFADPRDALEIGFRLQSQYRDESMQRILALAGSGSELGYRARVSALAQAFGQNAFGANATSGVNALNAAIAHVTGSELGANATLGSSENYLTGALAGVGERAAENRDNPHQIGAEPMYGPGGIPMGILPTFGTRAGAPTYSAVDTARPAPKPQEGATGTLKDGRRFVIKNGQPVVQK